MPRLWFHCGDDGLMSQEKIIRKYDVSKISGSGIHHPTSVMAEKTNQAITKVLEQITNKSAQYANIQCVIIAETDWANRISSNNRRFPELIPVQGKRRIITLYKGVDY